MRNAPARVLFVNSGILGHKTVGALFREVAALLQDVDPVHVDLSADLSLTDRVARRLLSLRFAPSRGVAANVDLRRWREELNVGLLAARRIAQQERQHGTFDVLHLHTQASAYASLRRMRQTPCIVSIDCTQSLASREAESAVSRTSYLPNIVHDGFVFRSAAAITATSRWAADDLARQYPDCAGKLHVLPYPVRTPFPASLVDSRFERSRPGSERRVRVLFVGGDFPRKGGPELLEAWTAGGFASGAVLQMVTEWPVAPGALPEGVELVRGIAPHSDAWKELWQGADMFVMPARHEAFGLVYQEAAAAGIPVVATRINAVPELVEDGRTGILVAPGDPAGLVRGIRTLIDSADLRRRMGAAAIARAATATAAAYAARLQTLIATALDTDSVYAA